MNGQVYVLALLPGNDLYEQKVDNEAEQECHDNGSGIFRKHRPVDGEVLRHDALHARDLVQLLNHWG